MMDSTEKLLAFLEQLEDRDDDELQQIAPVPPSIARMAIAAASSRVPNDAAALDEWAEQAARFCLSMRSDAHALELQPLTITVGEHEATLAAAAAAAGEIEQ
jgi:hypothetical protein